MISLESIGKGFPSEGKLVKNVDVLEGKIVPIVTKFAFSSSTNIGEDTSRLHSGNFIAMAGG